jgi:CheY-like chemotaxis protein
MTQEIQPATRHKVLLVDDDSALLDLYRELLEKLPANPEVLTANSGPRALAMLESDSFRLLVSDLMMPKMDGLQLLSIVRRKYPEMRTMAITSIAEEQFRSRVYALGVDMFWHKPAGDQETRLFLQCVESLLDRESEPGFRGVQSKSLVDIVQLECLSQSSSLLRITNGRFSGKIWIHEGEIIDAEAGELRGEEAFRKVLSWRAGTFETLAPDPTRPRSIFKSYNGLLLESAQAFDEALDPEAQPAAAPTPLSTLSQVEGLEFALGVKAGQPPVARGIENPDRMADWTRQTLANFRQLGETLNAGPMQQFEGLGPQRHVSLSCQGETDICLGWVPTATVSMIREQTNKVLALWAS